MMTPNKCKNEGCYSPSNRYGYCLPCWNVLNVKDRNLAALSQPDFGYWKFEDMEENLLNCLEVFDIKQGYMSPTKITKQDIFLARTFGFYFPPKDRVFYDDTIDVRNDGIIEEASLTTQGDMYYNTGQDSTDGVGLAYGLRMIEDKWSQLRHYHIKKINKLPNGFRAVGSGDLYKVMQFYFEADLREAGIYNPTAYIHKMYFQIDWKTEKIIPTIGINDRYYPNELRAKMIRVMKHTLAVAMSAQADQKYIWTVRTLTHTNSELLDVPVVFGVHEEQIKSLFYCRKLPITNTGRKRPILHWVQAHKRRIKEGIEINIDKYMRGIIFFKIGETFFLIERPGYNDGTSFVQWTRNGGAVSVSLKRLDWPVEKENDKRA